MVITSCATLLFLGVCSVVTAKDAPAYVEARGSFYGAAILLEKYLPDIDPDMHKPQDRPNLSLGIIGGLTGELVAGLKNGSKYDPLLVLQNQLPRLWKSYRQTAASIREKLAEAKFDVRPISELINDLCGSVDIATCNELVLQHVQDDPNMYQLPSKLLLQLGKTSVQLLDFEPSLLDVIKANEEVPYIMKNSQGKEYRSLLTNLLNCLNLMDGITSQKSV